MADAVEEEICVSIHKHDPDRPRRVAPGSRLCRGCLGRFSDDVAALPRLHAELGGILDKAGKSSVGPVSGSAEQKLPIRNLAAVEHRDQIRHDLVWHALWVRDERGINGPDADDLRAIAVWLAPHVDWLARQDDAADMAATFRQLAGRARGLLDPRDTMDIKLGPCVEEAGGQPCPGVLWGTFREDDSAPWLIECDETGRAWPTTEWLRLGHQIQARRAREQGRMAS